MSGKWKKIITTIVKGLMILAISLSFASCGNGKDKHYVYSIKDDGTVILNGRRDPNYNIIPKKLKGKIVTEIGNSAFYGCTLEEITIPETIVSIGAGAFGYSHNLKTVVLPEGLISINDAAFSNCELLKTINIPNSVKSIGKDAFANCDSLTDITIPGSVECIQANAFIDCNALENIVLGEGITEIGDCVFSECESIKNITLPNTITRIGKYSFRNCNSLESIKIPGSVKEIDEGAFASCQNLKDVNLDDTDHISLGIRSFTECTSLEEITFPCYYELYQSTFYKSGLKTVYRNTPKGIKLKFVKSRDMSDDGNVIYLTNYNKNVKDF